jgi:hypothetical protein
VEDENDQPERCRPVPSKNSIQAVLEVVLVGILPKPAAMAIARLEPFGLVILIGLLIILPMFGAQLGVDLNFISRALAIATRSIIDVILYVTGNG